VTRASLTHRPAAAASTGWPSTRRHPRTLAEAFPADHARAGDIDFTPPAAALGRPSRTMHKPTDTRASARTTLLRAAAALAAGALAALLLSSHPAHATGSHSGGHGGAHGHNPQPGKATGGPAAHAGAGADATADAAAKATGGAANASGGAGTSDSTSGATITDGSRSSTRLYALPAPSFTVVPSPSGCIVTDSSAGGAGWNLVHGSTSSQRSERICTSLLIAQALHESCQFATAATIRILVWEVLNPDAERGMFRAAAGERNLTAAECAQWRAGASAPADIGQSAAAAAPQPAAPAPQPSGQSTANWPAAGGGAAPRAALGQPCTTPGYRRNSAGRCYDPAWARDRSAAARSKAARARDECPQGTRRQELCVVQGDRI
jgi:hypothetical protein